MPIFGYVCNSCGNQHDYLVKVNTTEAPTCIKCGATDQAKQLSSGVGFKLSGLGWTSGGMNSPKVNPK